MRGKIESKIKVLYDTYNTHEQELLALIKGKDANTDATSQIQAKLDALSKQRETMLTLHSNSKGYTIQSLVEISSAFLASIIVLIGQITDILVKFGI